MLKFCNIAKELSYIMRLCIYFYWQNNGISKGGLKLINLSCTLNFKYKHTIFYYSIKTEMLFIHVKYISTYLINKDISLKKINLESHISMTQ